MISIVYSTRKENLKFKKYIKEQCKLQNVDIVEIINNNKYSLTEAYNIGLSKSIYDIVIFLHDDIYIEKGFDKKIYNHFNNSNFGILGKAGTTELDISGRWWTNSNMMVGCVKHSKNGKTWENKYSGCFKNEIVETAIIDGLFMAVNKKRIKHNFDENYKGFHFYDISFCLKNYISSVKIGVVFDFEITHLSIGETNDEWEKNRLQFVEEYKNILPVIINPIPIIKKENIILKKEPKVSIIIPTKSNIQLLLSCLKSFKDNVLYKNYEIIIADTGSNSDEKKTINEYIKNYDNIKLVEYYFYNFGQINNDVVENHISKETELIIFCNNDIKLMNDVVSHYVKIYNNNKNCGSIGCRLYFADNTLQHAGILIYINKNKQIGVGHKGFKTYYRYPSTLQTDTFGNTGALMGISLKAFKNVNMFPITNECFEDLILNMNLLKNGYKNYFIPEAVAYHYESQTRNNNDEKNHKQNQDFDNFVLPYLNKNLNNKNINRFILNIN